MFNTQHHPFLQNCAQHKSQTGSGVVLLRLKTFFHTQHGRRLCPSVWSNPKLAAIHVHVSCTHQTWRLRVSACGASTPKMAAHRIRLVFRRNVEGGGRGASAKLWGMIAGAVWEPRLEGRTIAGRPALAIYTFSEKPPGTGELGFGQYLKRRTRL